MLRLEVGGGGVWLMKWVPRVNIVAYPVMWLRAVGVSSF
jgi:hypothetical protein